MRVIKVNLPIFGKRPSFGPQDFTSCTFRVAAEACLLKCSSSPRRLLIASNDWSLSSAERCPRFTNVLDFTDDLSAWSGLNLKVREGWIGAGTIHQILYFKHEKLGYDVTCKTVRHAQTCYTWKKSSLCEWGFHFKIKPLTQAHLLSGWNPGGFEVCSDSAFSSCAQGYLVTCKWICTYLNCFPSWN